QMLETFLPTRNTHVTLYIIVPRGDFIVPDRPVDGHTFSQIGLKIEIAQPVALPSPHNRTSTHMITPHPVESFVFKIRVFRIFDKPMFRFLPYGVSRPALLGIILLNFFR